MRRSGWQMAGAPGRGGKIPRQRAAMGRRYCHVLGVALPRPRLPPRATAVRAWEACGAGPRLRSNLAARGGGPHELHLRAGARGRATGVATFMWQPPLHGNYPYMATTLIWQPPLNGNYRHMATALIWQLPSYGRYTNLCHEGTAASSFFVLLSGSLQQWCVI